MTMLDHLKKAYKGKKVFLTGHTGFKGAWLLKIFNMLGADVMGYALAPEKRENLYNLIHGDKLCKSVIADLRDSEKLIESMISFQPDFVFHLAAQPLVRLSYQIPADTFAINAIGTAHLLDGVRSLTTPCSAVLITTDKVYHNNEWVYPYRENDRLGGFDPYSASKACTELVIDSYRNSFFNPQEIKVHQKGIAVGRAGNVIGGGDWALDRLMPDIARAIGHDQQIIIRNPQAVRPWQHVLEPLAGYLLLGLNLSQHPEKYGYAYNFGPDSSDALTVKQMVKLAIDEWGKGKYEFIESKVNPHEAGLLMLDISKAISELGYKPITNANDAIKLTIEWYKCYFTGNIDIDIFTELQIKKFFDFP